MADIIIQDAPSSITQLLGDHTSFHSFISALGLSHDGMDRIYDGEVLMNSQELISIKKSKGSNIDEYISLKKLKQNLGYMKRFYLLVSKF